MTQKTSIKKGEDQVQALIDNLARNGVGENNQFTRLHLERFG
jgi:hypothetical protein